MHDKVSQRAVEYELTNVLIEIWTFFLMAVVLSFSLRRVLCLVMSYLGQAYFDPSFGYYFL